MSACTLAVDALPSTDKAAICCRLTRPTFAPCGNGGGGCGARGGVGRAAGGGGWGAGAGCACAAGGWAAAWAYPGAALKTSASEHTDTAVTTLLIANIPFIQ